MRKRMVKKKKGLVVIKSLLIVSSISAAIISGFWYTSKNNSGIISKDVYVENINLGGKKFSEAENLLQEKIRQPIALKKVEVVASNKTFVLDYGKLDIRYNFDEIIKEALNYGKDGNLLKKYMIKFSGERKDFKLDFTYNLKPIDEFIDSIEKEVYKNPVNAKISINHGDINITPEVDGVKLQKSKLKQDIISEINDDSPEENPKSTAELESFKPK